MFDKSSLIIILGSSVAADNYISSLLDGCQYVIKDITLNFSNWAGLIINQMDINSDSPLTQPNLLHSSSIT